MSFPPINLNVSDLSIQKLHVSDIVVDKTILPDTFHNIYYLFVTLFILVVLQTVTLIYLAFNYRKVETKRCLLGGQFDHD